MKTVLASLLSLSVLLALFIGQGYGASSAVHQVPTFPPQPDKLEGQFVQFKPNPLLPGTLNLFGYERERQARSTPILSPDKTTMAVSEVYFMPSTYQTFSRISLYSIGLLPSLTDIVSPETLKALQAPATKNKAKSEPTGITLDKVNPYPFWDRYSPEKNMDSRKILFEIGVNTRSPYQTDILRVIDWSRIGDKLLMVEQRGAHHLGVRRSLPMICTLSNGHVEMLKSLPKAIWSDWQQQSHTFRPTDKPVWDIRPLGWSAENEDDIIIQLIVFERSGEHPLGYWAYDTANGVFHYLGEQIALAMMAHYGWQVSDIDPSAPGGPHIYGPGETLPSEDERHTQNQARSKRNRVLFWKK